MEDDGRVITMTMAATITFSTSLIFRIVYTLLLLTPVDCVSSGRGGVCWGTWGWRHSW